MAACQFAYVFVLYSLKATWDNCVPNGSMLKIVGTINPDDILFPILELCMSLLG